MRRISVEPLREFSLKFRVNSFATRCHENRDLFYRPYQAVQRVSIAMKEVGLARRLNFGDIGAQDLNLPGLRDSLCAVVYSSALLHRSRRMAEPAEKPSKFRRCICEFSSKSLISLAVSMRQQGPFTSRQQGSVKSDALRIEPIKVRSFL